MVTFTSADTLHRLVKEALDSGAAASLPEAEAMFRGFSLDISIGEQDSHDPHQQAALLTAVALAQRVFLGGVQVTGVLNAPLTVPLPLGATLEEAVRTLGGVRGEARLDTPRITIGGGSQDRGSGFHVRTAFAGWRGGILPAHMEVEPVHGPIMPLAPMLAAALAVNESFLAVRTGGSAIGRRPLGLSLWQPASSTDWLTETDGEITLDYLPSQLWLVGLGHLGQAYLWGLGLLPYPEPSALSLVLQDVDIISPSSLGTSILSNPSLIGQKKTRAMAAWAERRGFRTAIVERLFDQDFRRQKGEPPVALCGLDNALGRRALDQVGFDLVVEAGLGRGHQDFRTMRVHTLPSHRSAAEIWESSDTGEDVSGRPAYEGMLKSGDLDRCGVTLLAGKAVGAPFVGAVAASLVLSEVLRLLHGGPLHQLVDLDLQGLEHRSTVSHSYDFSRINPGYVHV